MGCAVELFVDEGNGVFHPAMNFQDSQQSIKTLGLIAGNNQFPILFARAAKEQGIRVVAAGIRGDTSILLKPFVERFVWFKVGELKKLFTFFKEEGVQFVVMAGQVNPKNLFDDTLKLDEEFQSLFLALKDRKADTIFAAVAQRLKEENLELLDSTFLLKKYLAPQGTLTKRGPTLQELADIEFGQGIAKAMGGIDVGQTVVVKDKAIVAIEAMEGTDQCILRGGKITRRGAVVIKVSKPAQDNRFDVPVMGPRTIQNMAKVNASCLAIEADKTLIIDREKSVKLANQAGICIVAM
ncbi:MAG: UDP-2,3-diacylglucosamine diphosphatase LpxI [Candidatus Omnitrophica bacterium]|nr:UDP-2,3-diacylglucosamine diphosphatase LpxI [Candidatus Omnitrophota bacterium]